MIKRSIKEIYGKRFAILAVMVIGVVLFSFAATALAAEKKKAEPKPLTADEMRALKKKAKNDLNGTVWEVKLKEMAGTAGKERTIEDDKIYFEDMKVRSGKLTKEGFSGTNYSIRIKGKKHNIIIWETMQTSEDNGVAFWRGETDIGKEGDNMRGVLSWHITDEKKKDYTFRSNKKTVAAEPEPQVVAEPEPEVAAEPAVAEEAPEVAAEPVVEVKKEEAPAKAAEPVKVEPVKKEEKPKKKGWWQR